MIGGLMFAVWRGTLGVRYVRKALTVGLIDPSAGDYYWTNFWFEVVYTGLALGFLWMGVVIMRKVRRESR